MSLASDHRPLLAYGTSANVAPASAGQGTLVEKTFTSSETPESTNGSVQPAISDATAMPPDGRALVRTSSLSSITLAVPAVPEDNEDNLNNFSCGSLDLVSAMEGDATETRQRQPLSRKAGSKEYLSVEGNRSALSAMEWSVASLDLFSEKNTGGSHYEESQQMLDASANLTSDEIAALEALADSCRSMDLNPVDQGDGLAHGEESAAAIMAGTRAKNNAMQP